MASSDFLNLQIEMDEILQACHLKKREVLRVKHYSSIPSSKLNKPFFDFSSVIETIKTIVKTIFVILLIPLWGVGLAIASQIYNDRVFTNSFKHLIKIYSEIENFNSLIEGMDALDQAGRSGGTKRIQNREQMIQALRVIRADLICALRIEKTFRENPKLRSTDFNMNLEPLKILQMSEEASQYGDLFGQALQIGMSVQEEMQALQKKP